MRPLRRCEAVAAVQPMQQGEVLLLRMSAPRLAKGPQESLPEITFVEFTLGYLEVVGIPRLKNTILWNYLEFIFVDENKSHGCFKLSN